jgi:hypothetical protein
MQLTDLDPVLERWSKENKLFLAKEFKEAPVRSWSVVDKIGKVYQIWINIELDHISIHGWASKDKNWTEKVAKEELETSLSKCLCEVEKWMGPNKPIRV